ncbi:28S ribosomal protein S25, mitochondrial-like, partial [Plectropomus leopardus]|uniref:28S ribosomal protein S25, mitochondrial-like n=1 Tax=Plectropomus leopardus TaxID=160734 RepID=UPI001C4A9DD4
FAEDGEQVLVDVEGKDHKQISQHIKKILGKTEAMLQAEALARMQAANPANFGPKKYCLRECICEVEGQVPCPGTKQLPKEMTGKYQAQMAASQE